MFRPIGSIFQKLTRPTMPLPVSDNQPAASSEEPRRFTVPMHHDVEPMFRRFKNNINNLWEKFYTGLVYISSTIYAVIKNMIIGCLGLFSHSNEARARAWKQAWQAREQARALEKIDRCINFFKDHESIAHQIREDYENVLFSDWQGGACKSEPMPSIPELKIFLLEEKQNIHQSEYVLNRRQYSKLILCNNIVDIFDKIENRTYAFTYDNPDTVIPPEVMQDYASILRRDIVTISSRQDGTEEYMLCPYNLGQPMTDLLVIDRDEWNASDNKINFFIQKCYPQEQGRMPAPYPDSYSSFFKIALKKSLIEDCSTNNVQYIDLYILLIIHTNAHKSHNYIQQI